MKTVKGLWNEPEVCDDFQEIPAVLLNLLQYSYHVFGCLFGRFPIDQEAPVEVQLLAVALASISSIIIILSALVFALVAFSGLVWYICTRGDKIVEGHIKGAKWTTTKTVTLGKKTGQALGTFKKQAMHLVLFFAAIITSSEFIRNNWVVIAIAIAMMAVYVIFYVAPRRRQEFVEEVAEQTAEQLLDV